MRLLSVFLALWICLQACGMTPALATVSLTTEQKSDGLKGEVELNKVGALLFSEGIAEMTGNTIQVKGKQKGESKSGNLLAGTIFKVTQVDNRITGWVYFSEGPALA